MALPLHKPLPRVTADDVMGDAPKVAAYLSLIQAVSPDLVPEALLTSIDALSRPGLTVDMFMERLTGGR